MGTGHGADECDDRVALGGSGEQSGYEIGGARPRGDETDAGPAGQATHRGRHERRILFVATHDQLRTPIDQYIEDAVYLGPWYPEDVPHPLDVQGVDHHFAPAAIHAVGLVLGDCAAVLAACSPGVKAPPSRSVRATLVSRPKKGGLRALNTRHPPSLTLTRRLAVDDGTVPLTRDVLPPDNGTSLVREFVRRSSGCRSSGAVSLVPRSFYDKGLAPRNCPSPDLNRHPGELSPPCVHRGLSCPTPAQDFPTRRVHDLLDGARSCHHPSLAYGKSVDTNARFGTGAGQRLTLPMAHSARTDGKYRNRKEQKEHDPATERNTLEQPPQNTLAPRSKTGHCREQDGRHE